MLTPREKADLIKREAHRFGFLACGVAKAGFLEEEAPRLEQWLRQGKHGTMGYMANHFDLRLDPRKLVPGAKSVISLAYNYFTPPKQVDPDAPKLSTYAYGRDYHKVVKQRLKPLMAFITEQFGEVDMRTFVDSAPVLEKAWARTRRHRLAWQAHQRDPARRRLVLLPLRDHPGPGTGAGCRRPRTIAAPAGVASMPARRRPSPLTAWTAAAASATSPSN